MDTKTEREHANRLSDPYLTQLLLIIVHSYVSYFVKNATCDASLVPY